MPQGSCTRLRLHFLQSDARSFLTQSYALLPIATQPFSVSSKFSSQAGHQARSPTTHSGEGPCAILQHGHLSSILSSSVSTGAQRLVPLFSIQIIAKNWRTNKTQRPTIGKNSRQNGFISPSSLVGAGRFPARSAVAEIAQVGACLIATTLANRHFRRSAVGAQELVVRPALPATPFAVIVCPHRLAPRETSACAFSCVFFVNAMFHGLTNLGNIIIKVSPTI